MSEQQKPDNYEGKQEFISLNDRLEALRTPQEWIERFESEPLKGEELNMFIKMSRDYGVLALHTEARDNGTLDDLWGLADSASWHEAQSLRAIRLDHEKSYQGGYHSGEHLTLNPTAIEESANRLREQFDGLSMGEARMIMTTQVAAHESAHALWDALGTSLEYNGNISLGRDARGTRAYLANNPQEHLTGDWEVDVGIFEERFAEGFGSAAVGEMLNSLGADESEKKRVNDAIADLMNTSSRWARGAHPLDHLAELQHGETFSGRINLKDRDPHQYDIAIGYEMPFDNTQLTEIFAGMDRLLRDVGHDRMPPALAENSTPEGWLQATTGLESVAKPVLIERAIERNKLLDKQEAEKTKRNRVARYVGSVASRVVQYIRGESASKRDDPEHDPNSELMGHSRQANELITAYQAGRRAEGHLHNAQVIDFDSSGTDAHSYTHARFSSREQIGSLEVTENDLTLGNERFSSFDVVLRDDGEATYRLEKKGGISIAISVDANGDISAVQINNKQKGSIRFESDSAEWSRVKNQWTDTIASATTKLQKRAVRGNNAVLSRAS